MVNPVEQSTAEALPTSLTYSDEKLSYEPGPEATPTPEANHDAPVSDINVFADDGMPGHDSSSAPELAGSAPEISHSEPAAAGTDIHEDDAHSHHPDTLPELAGAISDNHHDEIAVETSMHEAAPESHDFGSWGGGDADEAAFRDSDSESRDAEFNAGTDGV
jgi:hypothetical protein